MPTPPDPTWDRDVDLIAVNRYLAAEPPLPQLTEAEQRYAARALTRQGVGLRPIAARLGVAERTVTRWRSAWAAEAQEANA